MFHQRPMLSRWPKVAAAAASSSLLLFWMMDRYERRVIPESERETCRQYLYAEATNHPHSLQNTGAMVLRNVLSKNDISFWKQAVREAASCDGAVNVDGRLHFHVAPTHAYHEKLARLGGEVWREQKRMRQERPISETPLTSLVRSYFHCNYGLTQLQFLTAVPDSDHQIWHRDNTQPGITVIIALTDIRHGATELLLHSHKTSILDAFRSIFVPSNNQPPNVANVRAYLNAGDALVYDARMLHRGRGYSATEYLGDRPVLVLRWDADLTPPPGCGVIQTAWHRSTGMILGMLAPGPNISNDRGDEP